MKINSKNSYYIVVIITGVLGVLLTLHTLRSNNKYPNKTVFQKTLMRYYSSLPHGTSTSPFVNQTFPFHMTIKETSSKDFSMKYAESDNTLLIENIAALSEKDFGLLNSTLKLFGIDRNTTDTPTVSPFLPSKVPTYRQVNLFFMIDRKESIEDYAQYHHIIEEYFEKRMKDRQMRIYVKYAYYSSRRKMQSNKDLYGDMKALNSKFFFEEINDEDSINFFLLNRTNSYAEGTLSRFLYNEDLKHLIVNIDLKKEFNTQLLHEVILLESMRWFIPLSKLNDLFISKQILNEMVRIYYSKPFQYHLLLSVSLKNFDKLNRIFPLYETIRTIDKVKEKLNEAHSILAKIILNNFLIDSLPDVASLLITTQYLMDSNELVSYEHYFSNEFKVGQFIPIMLPILYGFFKAFKGISL